jgi:hypothetical protein
MVDCFARARTQPTGALRLFGAHTIKLVVVGTAGRERVDLDAFTTVTTDEPIPPTDEPVIGGSGGEVPPPETDTIAPADAPADSARWAATWLVL